MSVQAQQVDVAYVKANAVRIDNVNRFSDSVFNLLNPFQLIMLGEVHGTNESALFVNGLANLFTSKGDSVQVGLEIPSSQLTEFLLLHSHHSIYQSAYFRGKALSGKETVSWATLISKLNENPRVKLFFFDFNNGDGSMYHRDSIMSAKIKNQFNQRPTWKMITLGGNFHNQITGKKTMISFLLHDQQIKICSLNIEYSYGSALANFGKGLEVKQLINPPSPYISTLSWDKFLLLVPSNSRYPYNGFFYIREITPAKLARNVTDRLRYTKPE